MASRALVLLVLALVLSPALAQTPKPVPADKKEQPAQKAETPAPQGDPIVARVNGSPIFRSSLEALKATLPPQLMQQTPPDQLYSKLLQQQIALELVSQAARKEKLDQQRQVKEVMALREQQTLQDAYFDGLLKADITEAKVRQRYDAYIKTNPAGEEVHARHILVPTEAEAKEIIQQLKKGADFSKLASEKTTDPAGKASGGDLGYFTQNDMVPEFAKAAFALKPGEFTQAPVHTQFGWHVIKVEDRRAGKAPTYEQLAPRLAQEMSQEIYTQKVEALAKEAKVEVFNPDGSKREPPPTEGAAPSAGAAPPTTAAPVAQAPQQPQLLPLDNGTPDAPAPTAGPPTLAPATQGLGK
jgi:peptidyl-prolyl cis-trans isomerase C